VLAFCVGRALSKRAARASQGQPEKSVFLDQSHDFCLCYRELEAWGHSLLSMLCRSKQFRIGLNGGMLVAALVIGLAQEALAATPTTTPPGDSGSSVAPLIISGRQSAYPPGTYSRGITEIIKMLEAKVAAQVILAYIQNSPIPYNPDATEIIALKEHGASTEMLTALLHHGDELRLQLAQAQSAVNSPPAEPAYDYAPEAAYPASAPYPESDEVPYPITYYTYAYRWPWLCQTPVCSSYRPYRFEHGCWYPNPGDGYHAGDGAHREWASAAPPVPQPPQSVSTPSHGHTSTLAAHPHGVRGSGRSDGRSAGRSR